MGKRQHQPFTPDTVDEQIEQTLYQQNREVNERIIHDLHTIYREDADVLARVRERFVASITASDEAQQPVALQQYQSGRFHSTEQQNAALSFKSTSRRRLSLLAAGLVAAFIVSSMLAVFTFVRHPGTQVASPQQQQTPPGLYMGNGDMVYRIDKSNGKVLWQYHLQDDRNANFGSHPPVVVILNTGPDNTVYAVSESTVYAIDATRGTLRWSHTLFKRVLTASQPIVSRDRVYVTVNDSVYALSTADGKILATYSVGTTAEPKQLTPAAWDGGVRYKVGNYDEVVQNAIQATVNDNILYITTQYANVYALRLPDGKQLWHRQVNQGQQLSAPQAVNGLVYVSSENDPSSKTTDYIYAFNAQTGATVWQSKTDGDVYNITVDHGVLYGSAAEKNVFAYDARTGKTLWSQNTSVAGIDAPQVEGNTVYITTFDNNTSASNKNNSSIMIDPLDATNGHLKNWVLLCNQSSPGDISIIALDGIIYLREKGNGTTAWEANGVTKIWHNQLGDKATGLTIVAV